VKQEKKSKLLSWLSFLCGPIFFVAVLFFKPFSLDENALKVLAVAVLMISWWITEALPMPAVAIIPLVLFPLMGISKIAETAAPYANEVIFLFICSIPRPLLVLPWESISIINTFLLITAKIVAKFTAVVVLPTPPF
jgi:sodium-dependent dicarboxylate transporter 2/3/5